jgi:hypothetical protein
VSDTRIQDCFSCLFSPPYKGARSTAGCSQLSGDEDADQPVLDFCQASGVSDDDNPSPGWPRMENRLACPGWSDAHRFPQKSLFHTHLDSCSRCRDNPFDLCAVGDLVLRTSVALIDSTELPQKDIESA